MTELVDEITVYDGGDVVKAAADFHARFEYIHPFADGNGRVGRTCLNYFLMIHDHPPLIIYNEDKRMYYECLQKYDDDEEIFPLYEFLKYETEKTWDKVLSRVEGIKPKRKGFNQDINEG